MTNLERLKSIADCLEKVTDGTCELNTAIAKMFPTNSMPMACPRYTNSIDSALLLANRLYPDCWISLIHRRHPDTNEKTCCAFFEIGKPRYSTGSFGPTFPIAIMRALFVELILDEESKS